MKHTKSHRMSSISDQSQGAIAVVPRPGLPVGETTVPDLGVDREGFKNRPEGLGKMAGFLFEVAEDGIAGETSVLFGNPGHQDQKLVFGGIFGFIVNCQC